MSPAQEPADAKGVLSALADPATTAAAATRLIVLEKSQKEVRQMVSSELPQMLLQTKNVPVVQSEAKVAGALQLESTIPSLIQLLNWPNFDLNTTMTSALELTEDPVARALYEIGASAELPLAPVLESKNRKTRERAMSILVLRNTPESRSILEKHLVTETDPHLRAYLIGNGIKSAPQSPRRATSIIQYRPVPLHHWT
jgi:HEAT repeat protein